MGEVETVWLVVKTAGFDHGVCYIAQTEAEALEFCREWAPDDDGHHDWRVQEAPIGQPIGDRGGWADGGEIARVDVLTEVDRFGHERRDRSVPVEVTRLDHVLTEGGV